MASPANEVLNELITLTCMYHFKIITVKLLNEILLKYLVNVARIYFVKKHHYWDGVFMVPGVGKIIMLSTL